MPVTLFESFRALFYTPFYLPFALGTFEAEGVDVALGTSPDLGLVAAHLKERQADVYWGGPMRIMVNHDRDPDCALTGFAEAVARDPFFIVGRTPRPDFAIPDLRAVTIATVSEVPTPWMCLQDDIRRAGIDPATIRRVADGTMAQNMAALRAGTVDAIQVFEPLATEAVDAGFGHVWYTAAGRGPCSYTTLYALRSTLETRPDEMHRMTRALYRCQKWLHAQDAAGVAAAVAPFFPELPAERLTRAVARYLDAGIWGPDPRLPAEGYERQRASLLSGGLIRRSIPYDDCMDMRFAEAVVAEDPPPA